MHVFSDIDDAYNRDFLEAANIVFLSDEALSGNLMDFLYRLATRYEIDIVVLGQGSRGALMYLRREDQFHDLPCVSAENIVSTVGAGDALFSGFLHFTAKGFPPVEALWHAQVFASAKIAAAGASQGFISEQEVLARRAGMR